MLAQDRQRMIAGLIADQASVSTVDLARQFQVSVETIRRDLVALEEKGVLNRVYGGAVSIHRQRSAEPSFPERMLLNREAKERIGDLAARLASPGETVFVDMGTTCSMVARAMARSFRGTVVTPSLLVAQELAEIPAEQIGTVLAPGHLRSGEWSVTGAATSTFLADIHYGTAFIGCGGIDAEVGVTDFGFEDAQVKQCAVRNAAKTYVLADSSKHGVVGSYSLMPWSEIHGLVTDTTPPRGLVRAIQEARTRVYLPEQGHPGEESGG